MTRVYPTKPFRQCRRCKQLLPREQFGPYPRHNSPNGVYPYCRPCQDAAKYRNPAPLPNPDDPRGDSVLVPLTGNTFAIIDREDAERVCHFRWGNTKGYATRLDSQQKRVSLHRLLLDASPEHEVDHINHNPLDNRKANLRLVTRSQNSANTRCRRPDGFKGVTKVKNGWQAQIKAEKRYFYLGFFETKEEAARAYDAKARELFGEHAHLNYP